MKQNDLKKSVREFVKKWKGHGYEKSETQKFWMDLLANVFGVRNLTDYIFFEEQVKDKIGDKTITNFIDAYIPTTRVMIEQKSRGENLQEAIRQSDGCLLTPFQQAKKYVAGLPLSQHPKWIVVCNFDMFLVYDMENPNAEPQEIRLENLENEWYRLQFLVDERCEHLKKEIEVSIKACKLVGRIYDALLEQYVDKTSAETLHSLNVLCVRLVFCLYAEDAGLFGDKTAFHDYLAAFPANHFRQALMGLFDVLDSKMEDRSPYLEEPLAKFPYVNGGLFSDDSIVIPRFTDEIRQIILDKASADFDWSEISPTIFGSLFESTLNPDTRRKGGMHYTSIENIHKVIDPLFMDDLETEFHNIVESRSIPSLQRRKLMDFQIKLSTLKFLDPACGSGNFLTETYLSLRRLENEVIAILNKGEKVFGFGEEFIKVNINQFYGIEINDFAVTVAKTALWIAECQMMEETERLVGQEIDFLPLKTNANIRTGNALRMDWTTLSEIPHKKFLCTEKLNIYHVRDFENVAKVQEPQLSYNGIYKELDVKAKDVEFKDVEKEGDIEPVVYDYIMGNPPFVGYTFQTEIQKEDLKFVDNEISRNLDYVAGWYIKASQLIQGTDTKCAFVSTNSVTQGEQVSILWKPLFERYNIQLDFAYRTFRWDSESEQKAHVHCVIVAFSHKGSHQGVKFIFDENREKREALNISPYLIDAPTIFIEKRKQPLCSDTPLINKGSQPTDGGNLIILEEEYDEFLRKEPEAKKYIREFLGAEEFINGKKRYCLWLVEASAAELRGMPTVMKRLEAVKAMRNASKKAATRKWAVYPYLFTENRQPESGDYLLIPSTSSERRRYVPIGFLPATVISSNANLVVPFATLYEFGVLTSNVHNAWMRTVCGRLKSDYRYSNDIVYNNFPWPMPTEAQRRRIEQTAQAILDARAIYSNSSLADLYDESVMPPELRKAHQANDRAVMQAYGIDWDFTEEEIVAKLFKMYDELTK